MASAISSESLPFPSTSSQNALAVCSDTMTTASTPPRPSLSTSLSDFALTASSSPSSSALDDTLQSKDDATPLMKRIRRPTIQSLWLGLDQRVNSPLANTFTLPSPSATRGKRRCIDGESEDLDGGFRDKDRMTTGSSSPSSESDFATPPLRLENPRMDELSERPKSSPMDISRSASPASALKPPADIQDSPSSSNNIFSRRLSQPAPPKPARLLSLRAEAHPDEIEVKHEAQVQRLLASFSGLPPGLGPSRSSRAAFNRGRYPEEAVEDEEFQREETPSDDGEADDDSQSGMFIYKVPASSEPINITKPSTPVPSVLGTPEDIQNGFRGISESPGNTMDIDMPMYAIGSPAMTPATIPPQQWRQTPPPTSASAVRTAKRKYEDRFDPYAPSAKRRAVSPSLSHLKDRDLVSPIIIPRSPILKPRKSFSQSQANSTTSSPTVPHSSSNYIYNNGGPYPLSGNGHHRSSSSSSVVSSPTVRASMILASPILRPVPRLAAGLKRAEEEEKIVDGAGENLKDLNIGRK